MKIKSNELHEKALRESIRNQIRTMGIAPERDGEVVFSMSRHMTSTGSDKRMIKHYIESHTDEFFSEMEALIKLGYREERAMYLAAKKLNEKYGEF